MTTTDSKSWADIPKDIAFCLEDQCLCSAKVGIKPGRGTYEYNGYLYAELDGLVNFQRNTTGIMLEVRPTCKPSVVPKENDLVLARVVQISERYAKCYIICTSIDKVEQPYRALLRRENISAAKKEANMSASFRTTDIIIARVLPEKKSGCYELSTADDELGVVVANSAAGEIMLPLNATEMQCPKTQKRETRKVSQITPRQLLKFDKIFK